MCSMGICEWYHSYVSTVDTVIPFIFPVCQVEAPLHMFLRN